MKIKVKTLDRRTFQINIGDDKTVGELKSLVCRLRGNWVRPDSQQLLYGGQVLEDGKCLRSYCIDERRYLLMLTKKPQPNQSKKSESQLCNKFTAEIEEEFFDEYSKPTQTPPLTKKLIMELGPWTENDVRRALLVSLNNPNRAMDYLMNGEEFFPNMVTPPDSSHLICKTRKNKYVRDQEDERLPKSTENIYMTEKKNVVSWKPIEPIVERNAEYINNNGRLQNLKHLLEMGFPRERVFQAYAIYLGDSEKAGNYLLEERKVK